MSGTKSAGIRKQYKFLTDILKFFSHILININCPLLLMKGEIKMPEQEDLDVDRVDLDLEDFSDKYAAFEELTDDTIEEEAADDKAEVAADNNADKSG